MDLHPQFFDRQQPLFLQTMDDLERYIEKRKKQSIEFAESFDAGYEELK